MYGDRKSQFTQTPYDQDYHLWLEKTIEQLRSHQFSEMDLENLIEELESMGKSDKRAIESPLTRLLEHFAQVCLLEIGTRIQYPRVERRNSQFSDLLDEDWLPEFKDQ